MEMEAQRAMSPGIRNDLRRGVRRKGRKRSSMTQHGEGRLALTNSRLGNGIFFLLRFLTAFFNHTTRFTLLMIDLGTVVRRIAPRRKHRGSRINKTFNHIGLNPLTFGVVEEGLHIHTRMRARSRSALLVRLGSSLRQGNRIYQAALYRGENVSRSRRRDEGCTMLMIEALSWLALRSSVVAWVPVLIGAMSDGIRIGGESFQFQNRVISNFSAPSVASANTPELKGVSNLSSDVTLDLNAI